MSTCPRCGADNYINTCKLCGFEQTRDVLSYYTLTRLNEDDQKLFSSKERITKQCAKKLRLLNRLIRESEKDEADVELIALFEEYISLTAAQRHMLGTDKLENEQSCNAGIQNSAQAFERYKSLTETESGLSAEDIYKLGIDFFDTKKNYRKGIEHFRLAAQIGAGYKIFAAKHCPS